jgi:hypothetical protein
MRRYEMLLKLSGTVVDLTRNLRTRRLRGKPAVTANLNTQPMTTTEQTNTEPYFFP